MLKMPNSIGFDNKNKYVEVKVFEDMPDYFKPTLKIWRRERFKSDGERDKLVILGLGL